jgi:hypothetical protein
LQVAAKTAQPEADASLDRAEWYTGELGDLVMGEPGEERQLDDGSLLWRERGQRRSQATPLCSRGDSPADVLVARSMSLEAGVCRVRSPRQLPRGGRRHQTLLRQLRFSRSHRGGSQVVGAVVPNSSARWRRSESNGLTIGTRVSAVTRNADSAIES